MRDIKIIVPSAPGSDKIREFPFRAEEGMSVLEALETIRAHGAGELCYRHSCHHGSCGTCGAIVEGREVLMCLARIQDFSGDRIRIEPLRKAQAISGIAVFPGELFASILPDSSYLRKSDRPDFERFEDCIECGLCLSACPVKADFRGPAGLAALARDIENRPERQKEDLAEAGKPDGVSACERHIACSRVCPQGVAPARKIADLGRLIDFE